MTETTHALDSEATFQNPIRVDIDVLPQHLNYRCDGFDFPQNSGLKFASYVQSQIERWLNGDNVNSEINVFYWAEPDYASIRDRPLTRFNDGPERVQSYVQQVINVVWNASINKFQACSTRDDFDRLCDREIHGVRYL